MSTNDSPKFLRRQEVAKRLGVSGNTVYNLMNDPTTRFPKSIQIGPRAVGWEARAIENWMRDRIEVSTRKA